LVVAYDLAQMLSGLSDPCSVKTTEALYLSSPDGGELLFVEADYTIQWETIGSVENIKLEYSANDGNSWTDIDVVVNTDSYPWIVPDINSEQCLVRISDVNDANVSDTSYGTFTIYKCQKFMEADLNGDCYTNFTDFTILAGRWLADDCGEPNWCSGADLNADGDVNEIDLSQLTEEWVYCGYRPNPACDCWPECWNWPTQCYGDGTGDGYVDSTDNPFISVSWLKTYPDVDYNPCFDFDRSGHVDATDSIIYNNNKNTSPPSDCEQGGIWPPEPSGTPM
jgi:hypothetical protein